MNFIQHSAFNIQHLEQAIALSHNCPKSTAAYSVGAVIVTQSAHMYTGYSRETSPVNHAEEEAIIKALSHHESLKNAVIYSSMEPCSTRNSKPKSCSELIIENQFATVVFASSEPDNFVKGRGEEVLKKAGIEVIQIKELAQKALEASS